MALEILSLPVAIGALYKVFKYVQIMDIYPAATKFDGKPGYKILQVNPSTYIIGPYDGKRFVSSWSYKASDDYNSFKKKTYGYMFLGIVMTVFIPRRE